MKKIILTSIFLVSMIHSFSQEWWHDPVNWTPNVNISMSGGASHGDFSFDFYRYESGYEAKNRFNICAPTYGKMVTVRANKRVGIYTEDPLKGFHIATEALFKKNIQLDYYSSQFINNTSDGSDIFTYEFERADRGDHIVYKSPASNSIFTIKSEGRVGIKTLNPESDFHLNGNALFLGTLSIDRLVSIDRMSISSKTYFRNDGKLGVNVSNPSEIFDVNGNAKITKSVIVQRMVLGTSVFPDYVFKDNYSLQSLDEVEDFILMNKHLPNVPSAKEVQEKGMNMTQMNILLTEKIEELTLYAIERQERMEKLEKAYEKVLEEIKSLRKNMEE
ncbi:MAG: hypothetical protein ACEPOV_04145 [Hyphomicrobiales bacterium]